MNWLLISSDCGKKDLVKESLKELFPESKIRESGSDFSSLKAVFGVLDEVSSCIFLGDKIEGGAALVLGYLCGKGISVITDADVPQEALGCFESLSREDGVKSICSGLRKNRKKIEAEVRKRRAYDYLFSHGIPFSPDHFSKYIENGKIDICECYLTAGMDVNSRDRDGTPMLNLAVRNDRTAAVEWLLKNGADVNVVSEDRGYSPLMDAVWRGNKEIAKMLLEKKPDVNVISKEGQSMIVLAVGADNYELCKLLCENGADVDIPDQMGMSAYGYAGLFKKEKIMAILEKYHKEG